MKILVELMPEDIREKLPAANTNPFMKFEGGEEETLPAYNGLTGDVLFRLPHPGGRRVSRQGLRKVLLDGIDVKWGKKIQDLSSMDECIQLTFADGETFDADFVVGADGASSKTRELLMGAEAAKPRLSGLNFATGCVEYGDAEKVNAIRKIHPVAAMVFYPDAVGGCGGKLCS
jgi:flavin-dependent dehydrogenase